MAAFGKNGAQVVMLGLEWNGTGVLSVGTELRIEESRADGLDGNAKRLKCTQDVLLLL